MAATPNLSPDDIILALACVRHAGCSIENTKLLMPRMPVETSRWHIVELACKLEAIAEWQRKVFEDAKRPAAGATLAPDASKPPAPPDAPKAPGKPHRAKKGG